MLWSVVRWGLAGEKAKETATVSGRRVECEVWVWRTV